MTGLDRMQTPKTRPMPQNRTALVASLDIGTSKIACLIARLKPCPPSGAFRGRSHAVELIGYSQIQSRGVKAGAVVDLAECEQAVRQAVSLAERMAKVRVESVLLSVSGGRPMGQLIEAAADISGGAVTPSDVNRITSTGMRHATGDGRTVLHALPVSYSLDGVKGIRDPRGMVARQFGVGAWLGVPIDISDTQLYVLCCLARESRPSIGEREVRLLAGLAESVRAELQHDGSPRQ